MGIKTYNPYTPSRRNMTGSDFSEITKTTPEKSLTTSLKKNAGRNNQGKITVRHPVSYTHLVIDCFWTTRHVRTFSKNDVTDSIKHLVCVMVVQKQSILSLIHIFRKYA